MLRHGIIIACHRHFLELRLPELKLISVMLIDVVKPNWVISHLNICCRVICYLLWCEAWYIVSWRLWNLSTENEGCAPQPGEILLAEYCAAGWHTNNNAACICAHRLWEISMIIAGEENLKLWNNVR